MNERDDEGHNLPAFIIRKNAADCSKNVKR